MLSYGKRKSYYVSSPFTHIVGWLMSSDLIIFSHVWIPKKGAMNIPRLTCPVANGPLWFFREVVFFFPLTYLDSIP